VAPGTSYLEADATYISLQHRTKKKKEKLEVKLGIGYTGKETRYSTGKSQRLKEKFTFVATGKDFPSLKQKRSSLEEMEIPGSPPFI